MIFFYCEPKFKINKNSSTMNQNLKYFFGGAGGTKDSDIFQGIKSKKKKKKKIFLLFWGRGGLEKVIFFPNIHI